MYLMLSPHLKFFQNLIFLDLKLKEILGLYVKLNLLFLNLNGVSILAPNIGKASKNIS